MRDETKKRVARILEESVEESARKQQEKADELEARARYSFGVMLGVCAVFVSSWLPGMTRTPSCFHAGPAWS